VSNDLRIVLSGGYTVYIDMCREVSRKCIDKIHVMYHALLKELGSEYEIVSGIGGITIYYDPRKISGEKRNKNT